MGVNSMRQSAALLVVLCTLSCKSNGPTITDTENRLAPPTLSVSATSRAVAVAGGPSELEVSAFLRNGTSTQIRVEVGAGCPLVVRIFSDPTAEYQGTVDSSMGCALVEPTLDLAPGDTATLTRVVGPAELSAYLPGTYGINVVVTTNTYLLGAWAGAITLPLASAR
jgi:hypothetical protein